MPEDIAALLDQLIVSQQERLLKCGSSWVPHLTSDDLLQPIDYPLLENNPLFRYEEGVLAGLQTVAAALRAHFAEQSP